MNGFNESLGLHNYEARGTPGVKIAGGWGYVFGLKLRVVEGKCYLLVISCSLKT